jgi:hypothetical protein
VERAFNTSACDKECLEDIGVQAERKNDLRFEVFSAGTMKNFVFWDVMPCGSFKNRRFGGT